MKFIIALLALTGPAFADAPVIKKVSAAKTSNGWTFNVTLSHADTGWDDYADGWRVLDTSGDVLGTRVLHHPHVNEQPFTRSLSGVIIPGDASQVLIEARDNVGGWSGERTTYTLQD